MAAPCNNNSADKCAFGYKITCTPTIAKVTHLKLHTEKLYGLTPAFQPTLSSFNVHEIVGRKYIRMID